MADATQAHDCGYFNTADRRPCEACGSTKTNSRCKACKKAYNKAYYAANRNSIKKQQKTYRAENAENIAAQQKAWAKANPDMVKAKMAAWDERHPGRKKIVHHAWRSENLEKVREANKAWRDANPIRSRANIIRYKARKRNVDQGVTGKQLEQLRRDQPSCVYCGTSENLSFDHKTPISRGGLHEIDNLQTACMRCNSSKGSKTHDEFMEHRRLLNCG